MLLTRAETERPPPGASGASSPPAVSVEPLAPADHRLWDRFVSDAPDGTFFHTTAWRDAVVRAFGHQAFYLVARRDDRWVGVLPLICVRSLLAGTMLVSVPYAVYGGVVSPDQEAAVALLEAARAEARRLGARCIDFRSVRAAFGDVPRVDRYVTFRRELPARPEDALPWLPRKARAAARHARKKFGLTVRFDDDQLRDVWRLYCGSMRRLASINYPCAFFEELVRLTPSAHLVSMVYDQDRPVGGLVSFIYGDTVLPYFVGSEADVQHKGVNNYIYLTLAERAVELGCRIFDFGRSRIDNSGCYNFKRFQGFEPTPLEYQCDTQPGHCPPNLTPDNPRFGLARRLWPRLPLAVTTRLGAWAARHVPG